MHGVFLQVLYLSGFLLETTWLNQKLRSRSDKQSILSQSCMLFYQNKNHSLTKYVCQYWKIFSKKIVTVSHEIIWHATLATKTLLVRTPPNIWHNLHTQPSELCNSIALSKNLRKVQQQIIANWPITRFL